MLQDHSQAQEEFIANLWQSKNKKKKHKQYKHELKQTNMFIPFFFPNRLSSGTWTCLNQGSVYEIYKVLFTGSTSDSMYIGVSANKQNQNQTNINKHKQQT